MDIYTLPSLAQKEGVSVEELQTCKAKNAGGSNPFIWGAYQIVWIQENHWLTFNKYEPLVVVHRGLGDSESFSAENGEEPGRKEYNGF